MKTILSVVGARPNFMKVAALHKAFSRHTKKVRHLICHTGQHFDEKMSAIFFKELELPRPDFYLGVGGGSHAEQTSRIMIEFEKVLLAEKPNLVIVVGDVNSTLACSLVAAKIRIPVAHVEAGLRSFDRSMPEEINRVLTDLLSDFLFVTEKSGMDNLKREGIMGEVVSGQESVVSRRKTCQGQWAMGEGLEGGSQKIINIRKVKSNTSTLLHVNEGTSASRSKVFLVGHVMIDNLVHYLSKAQKSKALSDFGVSPNNYILVTFHRPTNVDEKKDLSKLVSFLNHLSLKRKVIFPVHPRTLINLEKFGLKNKLATGVMVCEPLGYIDFLALMKDAGLVITDSGGIQEETTYLGVQCLTVRENTERPATVVVGTNQLAGTDLRKVEQIAYKILAGKSKKGRIPELWDGRAAERIVRILLEEFNVNGNR